MTAKDANMIEVALEEAIGKAWSRIAEELDEPGWIGNHTFNLMAKSALNILKAAVDNEEYMRSRGMLKE